MAGTTSLIYRFLGVDAGAGAQFDRMSAKTAELGASSSRTLAAVRGLAIGTALVGGAVAVASVKMAGDFQTAMLQIHTQANASTKTVAELSKGILEMAGKVSTTPMILADAAFHIASVGQNSLTAAQQLAVLKNAAEGAKIGNADLTDTTNALTAAVVSGIKGSQNFSHTMGVLNAAVGAGDMHMQDLVASLGTGVLAASKVAGLSLQSVTAAIAVLGDNNIRGATAGTRLNRVIMLMQAPSEAAAGALAGIGLKQTELATDLRKPDGLMVALSDLKSHLEASGLSAVKQNQVIAEAFGSSRGATNVEVLLDQIKRLGSTFDTITTGGKNFASAWTSYSKSFGAALDGAKAAGEALLITLGDHLLPTATKLMNWIRATAIPAVEQFTNYLEKNKNVAVGLAVGLGVLIAATSGPIAAILAIGAALVVAYEHFEGFRTIVKEVVSDVLSWAKQQMATFAAWWATNGQDIEEAARRVWTAIRDLVKTDLTLLVADARIVLPVLKAIFQDSFRVIGDIVAVVSELIDGHWSKALSDLEKLAQDSTNAVVGIFAAFAKAALTLLYDAGKALVQGLVNGVESMAKSAIGAVEHVVGGAVDGAKRLLGIKSPSTVFHNIGQMMAQGLIDGWNSSENKIKDALSTTVQDALSKLQTKLHDVLGKYQSTFQAAQKNVQSVFGARSGAIGSLAGTISGQAGLSGLFGTDANGNPTTANVGTFLSAQVGPLKQFAQDLKWAANHHMSPVLLSQIANLGAVQGDQVLKQFMSGQASIAQANAAERQINAYSRGAASTAEDAVFARSIAKAEATDIKQYLALEAIRTDIHKIAEKAGKEIGGHYTLKVETDGKLKLTPDDGREIIKIIRRLDRTAGHKLI